ncbi:unnamed protein product [Rotaria sp. Silwood1]|nr:unnamed protein product [Rotaria sp. Silwood1]
MLRIISYNIRGITTCKKQQLLKIWLNQNPHDIVMLQETHMTKFFHLENFKNSFLDYNIRGALGTWVAGGVLIMIKKKYNMVDYGSDTNGRIVYIKIECNHVPIVLVNVYAPAQITERCSFFKELFLYIPSTKWIIIGGDFNCTPNNHQDRNKLAAQTDNLSYRILLKEVINPLLLTEIFRRKQPRKIIYSYHASAGNYHSRIDLVFGSDIIYKNTHDIGYVPVGISDHDALVLSIKIPPSTDKNMHRRWICNPNVIKRKSFLEKFHRVWNIIINTADLNTTEWWNDFKTSLIMIIQQEEKELNRETRRELDELSKEYRFRATNPSNDDLAQLEIIRQKLHDALTEKFVNSIPRQDDRDFKCLSNLAKARLAHAKANQSRIYYLTHPSKGRVETDDGMMEICCNFYQDLYNVKPIDTFYWSELFGDIATLSQNDIDLLDRDITTDECYEALKAMQLGRVPGDDGLTIELWKFIFPIIGGIRQGCSLSGYLYVMCLEPLLNLIRKNPKIPGVVVPGSQYRSLVNTILQHDETNIEIKTLAYADDVCTFVFNTNDEFETYELFKKYSYASGGKTNDTKTVIFWISDCLDPPPFNAKIEREKCTFLGIPMDTQGQLPQEEIDKMDGGFGLIHLESMIISYRIKCGLTITSTIPKIWKLFALPYVGLHLYKYSPWLWTNLIPHLQDDKQFLVM